MIPPRDDFLQHVREVLDNVASDFIDEGSNDVWTKAILERMNELAEGYSFGFYATGYDREWLFDAVFWQEGDSGTGVFACVEIEWDSKDDGYHRDFQKILVARTKIPIFITQADSEEEAEEQIEDRREFVKNMKFFGNPRPAIFVYNNENGEWHTNL